MRYFFINTDAVSLGGTSPHDKWFEHGYAFAGGPISFGRKLGRLLRDDTCLMYANGIGIVGVGKVAEPWDGKTYSDPLVYKEPFGDSEYRIKVNLDLDLCSNPIHYLDIKNLLGWIPSQSLQMLKRDKDINRIKEIIKSNQT